MNDAIKKLQREISGPDALEKQILLLKLTDLLERRPAFPDNYDLGVDTPQRKWISQVRALVNRMGSSWKLKFDSIYGKLSGYWKASIGQMFGLVSDLIEELKLDLELKGRSDISTVYKPGEVYRFFADLKSIIKKSKGKVLVIDPFFDGKSFDEYLSDIHSRIRIQILAQKYARDVSNYVIKHTAERSSNIELRVSDQLHDRVVIIDDTECWVMGGSIKDAGKKPTYLLPLDVGLAKAKINIYSGIWKQSKEIKKS